MSLKALHIVFIAASILLTLFFGGWELNSYLATTGSKQDLAFGIFSFVCTAALVVYAKYVLKKLKHISYL